MLLRQILLVLAAGALGDAALRSAGVLLGRPAGSQLERVLGAAPLAAAFAVLWTLLVGLVGIGPSPVALAAGPVAWCAAMHTARPDGAQWWAGLREQVARARPSERIIASAAAGALAGCAVWIARHPGFDIDTLAYHVPDALGWLRSGHPGAVQTFSYDYPVGYYPVTGEVLLTWVLGISRTFAPLALFSPLFLGLTLVSLWRALVVLAVPRRVAALAVAGFCALPLLLVGLNLNAAGTDMPAVAWLACAAALALNARERPAALAPALIAAALGVGTKTTVAPLAVIVLAAGAWWARSALRAVRGRLAVAVLAGLPVAAPWYVRSALIHGWPLWPFQSGPTGDRLPYVMSLFHASFLSRPVATVRVLGWRNIFDTVGGALVLIPAVVVAPAIVRTRAVAASAAVALVGLLAWASAPFTGVPHLLILASLTLTTLRYMLGALAAATVALALAARDGAGPQRRVITGLLAGALLASLIADSRSGFPAVPALGYLLAGGAVGAGVGSLLGLGAARRLLARPPLLLAGAGTIAVACLALAAPHWLRRESAGYTYRAALLSFMLTQPGFAAGSQPISFAPSVVATLAGPDLRHPLELIAAREPCHRVRARLRGGWIVLFPRVYAPGITTAFDAPNCLRGVAPVYDDGQNVVYRPLG